MFDHGRDVMLEMIQDTNSSADERKYAAQVLSNFLNDAKSIGDGVAVLEKTDHDIKKAAAFGKQINGWRVGAAPVQDEGKYVVVYKQQANGVWRAVADIFNSDQKPQ